MTAANPRLGRAAVRKRCDYQQRSGDLICRQSSIFWYTIHTTINVLLMDPQFSLNMTTWYFVIPLLVIGLATLVWFIIRMKTTLWKRVTLSIVSLFAFFGFVTGVLAVYYQFNKPFSAMFKYYAYSKLAPDDDPFVQANGDEGKIIKMLVLTEGHKKDGQVFVAQPPSSVVSDFVGFLFTPGKWQAINIKDHAMTVQDYDKNGQPDIIHTSLWWSLTNDPYRLTVSAE
jgi:hypothetical protein